MAQEAGEPGGEEEAPKLFRELDFKRRMVRAALIAFTIYHVVAMLAGGATKDVKRTFAYVFGGYDEGLRMTNSWGMFGKPPTSTHVTIEGELMDGSKVVLSTTRASDRTAFERLRDVRIRKIQGKLTDGGDRTRWGLHYLDHFCRWSRARGKELKSVKAVNQIHATFDDAGQQKRKPSTQTLISKSCQPPLKGRAPNQFIMPSQPKVEDEGEL